MTQTMAERTAHDIQADVERLLATTYPEVEVLLVELSGTGGSALVRLFVDHPDGVSLALCEGVTGALSELLSDYGVEVSSPGAERPLTKPGHFERFVGSRVHVRTREPIDGQRNFNGELVAADREGVTLGGAVAGREGVITIPYEQIGRANLAAAGGTR